MQAWGEVMFKLPFRLLLVACVLAHSGCAYTLKETGHRDLDRSFHCCETCTACLAKCCMVVGAGIGLLVFWSWSDSGDEGLGGDDQPSANELWRQGYGYNNPNPERIRKGQEPEDF
jgi:hypothetical protein